MINSELTDELFEPESFDAVTLAAVLEHVEHPMVLLSSINRVLQKGGVLFLDVPNEGSFAFSLVNLYFRLRRRDWAGQLAPTFSPYHIQGFTRRSLTSALNQSNFEILSLETYGVGDDGFNPASLAQKVEAFGWRVVDRVSVMAHLGTGLLAYARRRR